MPSWERVMVLVARGNGWSRWTVKQASVSADRLPVFKIISVVCLFLVGWR